MGKTTLGIILGLVLLLDAAMMLAIWRNVKRRSTDVVIGERPDEETLGI